MKLFVQLKHSFFSFWPLQSVETSQPTHNISNYYAASLPAELYTTAIYCLIPWSYMHTVAWTCKKLCKNVQKLSKNCEKTFDKNLHKTILSQSGFLKKWFHYKIFCCLNLLDRTKASYLHTSSLGTVLCSQQLTNGTSYCFLTSLDTWAAYGVDGPTNAWVRILSGGDKRSFIL